MSAIVLVAGGARSGKSSFAQETAAAFGGRIAYVVTAEPGDREMAERIAAHAASRPAAWLTVEAPRDLAGAIASCRGRADLVVVDCLTVYLANLLVCLAGPREEGGGLDARCLAQTVETELEMIIRAARESPAVVLFVANEVGLGVVPPFELGRVFRDLAGRANQRMAAAADRVYYVRCGLAAELKSTAVTPAGAVAAIGGPRP